MSNRATPLSCYRTVYICLFKRVPNQIKCHWHNCVFGGCSVDEIIKFSRCLFFSHLKLTIESAISALKETKLETNKSAAQGLKAEVWSFNFISPFSIYCENTGVFYHLGGGEGGIQLNAACLSCERSWVRFSLWYSGFIKARCVFNTHPFVQIYCVGEIREGEVACSISNRERSPFELCVWRAAI